MIRFPASIVVALLLWGCGPKIDPRSIEEELPPWMTRGEQIRLDVASKLLDGGATIEALKIVRSMRQEGFDSGELDLLQGRALRLEGVDSEAEKLLLSASKKMPRESRPHRELCVLYADTKQIEPALEACRKATKVDGEDPRAWNNYGFLLLAADRTEEALEALGKSMTLDATDPRTRNNLALAQAAVGKPEQAYRTFMSTSSKAEAAYNVALALERFESTTDAKRYYARALQTDPDHVHAKQALERLETPSPSSNPNQDEGELP